MKKEINIIKKLRITFCFVITMILTLSSSTVLAEAREANVYSFNIDNKFYYNMLVEENGSDKKILSTWCKEQENFFENDMYISPNMSFYDYLVGLEESYDNVRVTQVRQEIEDGAYSDEDLVNNDDDILITLGRYFKKIPFKKETSLMFGNAQYGYGVDAYTGNTLYNVIDDYSFKVASLDDQLVVMIYNGTKLCYSFLYTLNGDNKVSAYDGKWYTNLSETESFYNEIKTNLYSVGDLKDAYSYPSFVDGKVSEDFHDRVFRVVSENGMQIHGVDGSVVLTDTLYDYDAYSIYQLEYYSNANHLVEGTYFNLKYAAEINTSSGKLYRFYYPIDKGDCIDIYVNSVPGTQMIARYGDGVALYKCLSLDKEVLNEYYNKLETLNKAEENKDLAELLEKQAPVAKGTVAGTLKNYEERKQQEALVHTKILEYAKPIFMFLVFISIIAVSLYEIVKSQDVKSRILVKEKIKHILIGCVLFMIAGALILIARGFLVQTFSAIDEATAESNVTNQLVNDFPYVESFFMKLLGEVMDILVNIIKLVVQIVMVQLVGEEATADSQDMGKLIFGGPVDGDYTLSPFTKTEWTRYMYGYNSLVGVFVAFLAIALVKIVCEILLNAGNAAKMKATKEQCMRILIAMFMIIAGPYAVRTLLTIFNYLVTLVPLKEYRMDITFENLGIIGSMANLAYLWVKIQIYITFIVRKIMITFMLLLTPVVFGMWAISSKTRGVSLWCGELFTNCAMHLCYAVTFMIINFVLLNNSNAFITLIVVSILVKLAHFFTDSLQGLMQKWGGIDESGAAEQTLNKMKGWTVSTGRFAKNSAKWVGGNMAKVADKIDSNGITRVGTAFHNVGNIMSGNVFNVRTKRDRIANARQIYTDKAAKLGNILEKSERDIKSKISNTVNSVDKKNYKNLLDRANAGNLSEKELDQMQEKGGVSADIANYYKDYEDYRKYSAAAKEARQKEKNPGGIIGGLQAASDQRVQRQLLDNAKSREISGGAQKTLDRALPRYEEDPIRNYAPDYENKKPTVTNVETPIFADEREAKKADDKAISAYTGYLIAEKLHKDGKMSSKDFLDVCRKVSRNINKSRGNINFTVKVQSAIRNSVNTMSVDANDVAQRVNVSEEINLNYQDALRVKSSFMIPESTESKAEKMVRDSVTTTQKFFRMGE